MAATLETIQRDFSVAKVNCKQNMEIEAICSSVTEASISLGALKAIGGPLL
jgi:hypothetical protein